MPETPIEPRIILDHIQDGLLIVDTEGRVLWANEVFREMIGRPGEDLVGRTCCDLHVGSFCDELCPIRTTTGGACSTAAHFNVLVSDRSAGSIGSYCFVTTPIRDAQGRLLGFMENYRGMDRVRDTIMQLEEVNQAISAEREKTERLIDSMADGVFAVDQELRIRRFSRSLERMLGVPAAEAIGQRCREVLRGTLCDSDCPLVWSRDHGKPVTGCREELFSVQAGHAIPVAISTGELRNEPDFERGLFGIVSDRSEIEELRRELQERSSFHGIIGRSAGMRALFQQIEAVAPTEATVLIFGESGTGKELVARAIHRQSNRASGPFVSINCAALVEELLESELFGHVRGAFTGAVRDRKGRFEQAAGGTLFLDEVGDTSPALQAKLLRAVQEKTIEPVGSGVARRVDVRIVTATNKDLLEEVRAGRFREDLYYRLNVVPILLPPLRQRRDDIPLLVEHFLEQKARSIPQPGAGPPSISERALAVMMEYTWPGNVRELEHAVEYALISSDSGRIERAFLPLPLRQLVPATTTVVPPPITGIAPAEERDDRERAELLAVLERYHWNVSRTAEVLGIGRTTLWRRMKSYGIEKRR